MLFPDFRAVRLVFFLSVPLLFRKLIADHRHLGVMEYEIPGRFGGTLFLGRAVFPAAIIVVMVRGGVGVVTNSPRSPGSTLHIPLDPLPVLHQNSGGPGPR